MTTVSTSPFDVIDSALADAPGLPIVYMPSSPDDTLRAALALAIEATQAGRRVVIAVTRKDDRDALAALLTDFSGPIKPVVATTQWLRRNGADTDVVIATNGVPGRLAWHNIAPGAAVIHVHPKPWLRFFDGETFVLVGDGGSPLSEFELVAQLRQIAKDRGSRPMSGWHMARELLGYEPAKTPRMLPPTFIAAARFREWLSNQRIEPVVEPSRIVDEIDNVVHVRFGR